MESKSDWQELILGDIADEVTVGYVGTMVKEYVPSGVPFLRSLNVEPFRLNLHDLMYISEDFHRRIRKSVLRPSDVVIVRTGKPGTAAVIPDTLPEANCSDLVIVRPGPSLDSHFLSYYINSIGQHHVTAYTVGAVQQHFNVSSAKTLKLYIPPLPEQRAIARILGALDDKIELNRRMNRTLEAMAAALYKSWFVDFDPVVAKAEGRTQRVPAFGMNAETAALFPDRFVSSEQGDRPKDWPIGRLDDLIVLQRGFDLPGSQRTPGPYPVIAASGPSGTHDEFKVQGPGVTTGRSGVLGNVFFVHSDFWPLNTSLWVKEYKNSNVYHAYFLLGDLDFETFNAGSAVPTLNRNHVHNLPTVVPPPPVLDKFAETAAPLFSKQKQNHVEVETLASIRDTLLPKLLSGEVRLRQAEAMINEL